MTLHPRSAPLALGAGLVLVVLLLAGPAPVRGGPDDPLRVVEVTTTDGSTRVKVTLGGLEVHVGQTVEVRRGERVVGYGAVESVASDHAVALIGTVVADALEVGDQIVLIGSFRRGARATTPAGSGAPRSGAEPQEAPARAPEPARGERRPSGRVLSVARDVVLVDFGREEGLAKGDKVSLREGDREVGTLTIDLLGAHTAGGTLASGEAIVGLRALSLGPAPSEPALDFVALDFLGVVADPEHPTPHRAACHVGVPVRRVMRGSPAERAGIGVGDRVIAVDGRVVRDAAEIRERAEARTSEDVRVVVLREDRLITLNVAFR